MQKRGSVLVASASNYYLAHLTQSAQISESEFIPQSCSTNKPQNLHSCTLKPGRKTTFASLNADAVTGKCCLWRKCPMMTISTAGWPLSLIHHSHTLRRFAYSLHAAYQHQPFSHCLVLLFLHFPFPAFFLPPSCFSKSHQPNALP